MVAIGMGLAWASYTLGLWGWCLVTGRNVSLRQLLSFTQWPPDSAATSGSQAAPPAAKPAAAKATAAGKA